MLADLVAPTARTSNFAWYNFVGYLATAVGSAEAGRLVDFLHLRQHWTPVQSCRAVFVQYSFVGAVLLALILTGLFKQWMSVRAQQTRASEEGMLEPLIKEAEEPCQTLHDAGSCQNLLQVDAAEERSHMLGISPRSTRIMLHLSCLFAIDSIAGSLVTGELTEVACQYTDASLPLAASHVVSSLNKCL